MTRYLLMAAGFALVLAASTGLKAALPAFEPAAASRAGLEETAPAAYRALLDQYCVTCHNQRSQTADLTFDAMDLAHIGDDAVIWERTVRKLRGRMMPPPGVRQPDPAELLSFVLWLETSLDQAASPNPGYVAPHRLNRSEYENSIKELFGVEVDAASLLPLDDVSQGFYNIASVLRISPAFIDQYVSAARLVSVLAVGEPAGSEPTSTILRGAIGEQNPYVPGGLPLGTAGGMLVEHFFPADGEYEFGIGGGGRVILTIDGVKVYDSADVAGSTGGDRGGQGVRVRVEAGLKKVGLTSVAGSFAESDATLQAFAPGGARGGRGGATTIQVTGPFNPTSPMLDSPARQKLFICRPNGESDEVECATRILSNVARRAFRRPVTDEDMAAPLAFFRDGRERGDFEMGIQYGLMAVLASPKFLYRIEHLPEGLPPGSVYPISDIELASRLSFFLWSQNPDDELLNLAIEGRLRLGATLEQQVRRMLADRRARALVTNFTFQWLHLDEIDEMIPDAILFPNFNQSLRQGFRQELELLIESIIAEDRSVVELLTADYTFLNERLALHYGIPDIRGEHFRRITLADPDRWGLLGKGGVLMVTSYPDRTAPVLRGAWILENILGTPPATPPPDVEGLEGDGTVDGKVLTIRERMELHNTKPGCVSCHGVMDPLGFALENFDVIGEFRTMDRYARTPIDTSGRLVDGTAVNGPTDLREALTRDAGQFVQTFTERLLMYGTGRHLEYYDMPVVRQIVREAARHDHAFSSIVLGIVNSAPFQMKTIIEGGSPAEVATASPSNDSTRTGSR